MRYQNYTEICESSDKEHQTTIERHLEIEELRGTIVHLDEVLTMSARMAAATGDLRWEERYHGFEPKVDAAIKSAIELAPEAYSGEAATQTDAANIKLVAMEKRAFDLARRGRVDEAKTLLFSHEYESQKKVYAQGMAEFAEALSEIADVTLQQEQHRAFLHIAAVALLSPFLVVRWWRT